VIDEIFPDGNAFRDGRLCIGDKILEINDEDIMTRSLAEATRALGAVVPLIRLTVYREFLDESKCSKTPGNYNNLCMSICIKPSFLFPFFTMPLILLMYYSYSASPDPELVELSCDDDTPLGIQIRSSRGQPGVFIHLLQPDSLADQSGLLFPGDRILEANGQDLKFVSLEEAATVISVRF